MSTLTSAATRVKILLETEDTQGIQSSHTGDIDQTLWPRSLQPVLFHLHLRSYWHLFLCRKDHPETVASVHLAVEIRLPLKYKDPHQLEGPTPSAGVQTSYVPEQDFLLPPRAGLCTYLSNYATLT